MGCATCSTRGCEEGGGERTISLTTIRAASEVSYFASETEVSMLNTTPGIVGASVNDSQDGSTGDLASSGPVPIESHS